MASADVARAIAFFEASDDADLLRETLRQIRPRAAAAVQRIEASGRAAPAPAGIAAASEAASREEALRIARGVQDFAELQVLSRAIGRRLETLLASPPG
jgi:hypothetical protein